MGLYSPENKELVREFFASLDEIQYPQPIVGDAGIIAQTDLNMWRMRELIPSDMWEKNGRVTYSGRGLLFATILHEYEWILRPTKGAEVAAVFMPHIDKIAAEIAVDDFAFAEEFIHFSKPRPAKGDHDRARLWYPDEKMSSLVEGLGLPIYFSPAQKVRENPLPSDTVVLSPIGEIIFVATWRAKLAMRERQEA